MRDFSRQNRQYIACGHESPVVGARAWTPSGYSKATPSTCPGYTTKLPEVCEAVEARFYLQNGSLSSLIRGQLTDNMKDGIAILQGAEAEMTRWSLDNPEKK